MSDNSQRARDWFLNADLRDQVPGYLQSTQARALHALLEQQAQAGIAGSLAEIGVYVGKTLIGLGRAARHDEPVLAVDPLIIDNHDLAPLLTRNLKAHLTAEEFAGISISRVLSTQLDVLEWMRSLKRAARFIHLDGHHSRESMLHDLQLAASWLENGALVVIDDFLNELHPDLTSGILDGLAAHPQLEPVAVIPRMGHIEEGGSKLVCTTRGDGTLYREALDRALADQLRPWNDRMLGREVRVYRCRGPSIAPAAATAARQQTQEKPLPVVFALQDRDGFYWINTAVAITSLAQYASQPVEVHVLHDESLHDVAKQRLTEIAGDMQIDLTLAPVRLPNKIDISTLRQFGAATLFRLLVPQLFADRDLVIYLNSDLVVNGLDVSELAVATPHRAPVSAAIDPHIAITASHNSAVARIGLDAANYVNAGVLVFRPQLIAQDLLESFIAFSMSHPHAIHPDQDFLNTYFKGRIHVLNERFNYPVSVYQQSMIQPVAHYWNKILHYSGSIKPLDGFMATGIIPFWIHAQRVPEAAQALAGKPTKYLFPVEGNPETLVVHEIEYAAS